MFGFGKKSKKSLSPSSIDQINDQAKQFEIIFNAIDDGVVLIDGNQIIKQINPGASSILGWAVDEATDISVLSVMKFITDKAEPLPNDDNPFISIFKQRDAVHNSDLMLTTKAGKQLTINLSLTPLADARGKINAVVAIFRDVSQERAEEQQRGDFISTASHEMRTPVAAIEGYLALTLNDKVATIDERARGYINKAHESTQHLGQLFQDLLTSSRAEDGRLISHPSVVEIGEFLKKISEDMQFTAEKKGLDMEFKIGTSATGTIDASNSSIGGTRTIQPLYYVLVDPDRLREVITNLFDNAVKYTPEGKVTLGVNGDASVVQCYVRDTGLGIPATDVPHLFQKFYRVDNSATRTIGGTGLGLFICRKIIELYNGRLWVESELGKGSSFYINLPRLSEQKAQQLRSGTTITPNTEP